MELDRIFDQRRGDDPELDKNGRTSLNSISGRRFRMEKGNVEYRSVTYQGTFWLRAGDAKNWNYSKIKKISEDIEGDARSLDERVIVEKLRNIHKEHLEKEAEARQIKRQEKEAQ